MFDGKSYKNPLGDAEKTAAHLPPLLVEAERVARGFMRGVHGRRRVGMGESFWQFRPYEPGDTMRSVDWRQSARRDQAYVRQMEWEAAQTVWLWRDPAPSMTYRSAERLREKGYYADVLALALGALLLDGGEQVGILGTGKPVQRGVSSLPRLYENLFAQPERDALQRERLIRESMVIAFSDFWQATDKTAHLLRLWAEQGVHGLLIQVLDPAERDFPFDGRIKMSGMTAEETPVMIENAQAVRRRYLEKFSRRQEELRGLAHAVGWRFVSVFTDAAPQVSLAKIYDVIAAGGRGGG